MFDRDGITRALTYLGELAAAEGATIDLFVVGGARIVLTHAERESTKDIDAVVLAPAPASRVRELAERVAAEFDLPKDWLNEGAKGFIGNRVQGDVVFEASGVRVRAAPDAQMLALKLWAWRDDVDRKDAMTCLARLSGTKNEIWSEIQTYISEKSALYKVQLAYDELWELCNGSP